MSGGRPGRKRPAAPFGLFVAGALGIACGPNDPTAVAFAAREGELAWAEATCRCELGEADRGRCIADRLGGIATRDCREAGRRARLPRAQELRERLACTAEADAAAAACLDASDATCEGDGEGDGGSARSRCAGERELARDACPEAPPADTLAVERFVWRCLGGPGCPSVDLGTVDQARLTGSTTDLSDDFDAPCAGLGGRDVSIRWTAPTAGRYRIDTAGSDFDAVLTIYRGCLDDQAPLACDDDDDELTPLVTLAADAEDAFLLVVDGFDGTAFGDFILTIRRVTDD
ncbi:MAG TPA: hypothetical protein RMF84_16390 [Polyangiaceae bacterium LLY-WYZ-14_1]|nr:hypothetical protein [Polyangiaceae bacterium LLY-WYZ-14_1]